MTRDDLLAIGCEFKHGFREEFRGARRGEVFQLDLRNYYANIGAFHVTLWWQTLIELRAWHKPQDELTDRSASPWDRKPRRPSHADRRNALRRQCLANEFSCDGLPGAIARKIQSLWNRLAKLVV